MGFPARPGLITLSSMRCARPAMGPSARPASDKRSTAMPMAPPEGDTSPTLRLLARPKREIIAASCSMPSGSSISVTPLSAHTASSAS